MNFFEAENKWTYYINTKVLTLKSLFLPCLEFLGRSTKDIKHLNVIFHPIIKKTELEKTQAATIKSVYIIYFKGFYFNSVASRVRI